MKNLATNNNSLQLYLPKGIYWLAFNGSRNCVKKLVELRISYYLFLFILIHACSLHVKNVPGMFQV